MTKSHYHYDPETLSYNKVEHGFKYYISQVSIYLALSVVLGVVFFFVFVYIFDSPEELKLKREKQELITQYHSLEKRLQQIDEVLEDVHVRDENIYRVIYEADSIPTSVRKAGFGGVNRYENLENMSNSELVIATTKHLDMIAKQLYVQSLSFDEIIELAKRNKELTNCVPAIMPLNNKDLRRM